MPYRTILVFCVVFLGSVFNTAALADEPARPEITIQASSTLPHRDPSRYGVANLTDINLDTAWCEGVIARVN